ncbi:hypothetical protein NJ75_00825 [Novosphingobium subterraneum]|uniref:Uncharacterized protein n=1 Tax=Novosphingobium subterraneum TaxID=48936 RepID=A0A0B8ZQK3_9SPHN|nr:hypothetical protein NJ75_00825 [Novosphingobium subterraneum]
MANAFGAIGAAGAQRVQRGASPKTHRAIPAVTQGQTGQPRADSTAPNPERRCGCGTRHDCATVSAQTTGSFHAAACQKPRQYASRCQSFVLSHVSDHQAEPTRGSEPPPATRSRSRAPSLACHNGTAPVARSVISHRRNRPHSPADDLPCRASPLILSLSKDAHPDPLQFTGGGMKGQRLTPAIPQAGGPRDFLNAVKLVAAGWANQCRANEKGATAAAPSPITPR